MGTKTFLVFDFHLFQLKILTVTQLSTIIWIRHHRDAATSATSATINYVFNCGMQHSYME